MDPNAVELVGITKIFGGLQALDNVSLRVPIGERRAVIGPNGAGKTTLFNCIAGSLTPSRGKNFLFGHDVTSLPEYKRISMGLARTYQITNVFHRLTVLENVLLAVQGTHRQKWIFHRTVDSFPESLEKAMEQLVRIGLSHRRTSRRWKRAVRRCSGLGSCSRTRHRRSWRRRSCAGFTPRWAASSGRCPPTRCSARSSRASASASRRAAVAGRCPPRTYTAALANFRPARDGAGE